MDRGLSYLELETRNLNGSPAATRSAAYMAASGKQYDKCVFVRTNTPRGVLGSYEN